MVKQRHLHGLVRQVEERLAAAVPDARPGSWHCRQIISSSSKEQETERTRRM